MKRCVVPTVVAVLCVLTPPTEFNFDLVAGPTLPTCSRPFEAWNFFTEAEKKYIHYSGLLIIYMQALRFLTDYLNGDIYYQISYKEENLNKAKNQLILLQQLEEFLKKEYDFSI